VVHDPDHAAAHEVTTVEGEHFPPCNYCGKHPRFVLVHEAIHIGRLKEFAPPLLAVHHRQDLEKAIQVEGLAGVGVEHSIEPVIDKKSGIVYERDGEGQ